MDRKQLFNYFLEKKILTKVQLEECIQKSASEHISIEEILIRQGYLKKRALHRVLQNFQETMTVAPASTEELNKMLQSFVSTDEKSTILEELESWSEKTGFSKEAKNSTTDTLMVPEKFPQTSYRERTVSVEEAEKNATASFRERFNSNRYEILETLGKGGMGIVQRVQDRWLEREVALKRIIFRKEKEVLSDTKQAMLWRLMNEATITAKLEHPNIIPLFDINQETDGTLYFTMQQVHGETLSAYLKKIRKKEMEFQREKLLSIFLKVCEAISYAHSIQVIHRDLKPDNIMVGQFGEVYVMDWGIAKIVKKGTKGATDHPTPEETIEESSHAPYETIGGIGTPGYMPPEQAQNASQVKFQADIYALGKILRECFTLFSPLEELSLYIESEKKSSAFFGRKKIAMDYFQEKIPQDIQAIIEKASHENWHKRYRSVQDLIDDIERYRNHLRISSRKYHPFELLWKWTKRNTRLLAILTILFLITISIMIYQIGWSEIQKLTQQLQNKQSTASVSEGNLEKALISSFEEGKKYFLTSKNRSLKKDHYYQNVFNATACLTEESHLEEILKALVELSRCYEDIAKDQSTLANKNYQYHLAQLAQTLIHFKKKDFQQTLLEIREKTDPNGSFRQETEWGIQEESSTLTRFEPDLFPIEATQETKDLYERACHALEEKNFETSLRLFHQLTQQYPQWSEPYLHRGRIHYEIKEYEIASTEWKNALKYIQNPFRKIIICEYFIELENARKDLHQTILWYQELLKYDPHSRQHYAQLAQCYLQKNDFRRAIQQYQNVLYLDPENSRTYFDRGEAYFKLDQKEEAKSDFTFFLKQTRDKETPEILECQTKIFKYFPELENTNF